MNLNKYHDKIQEFYELIMDDLEHAMSNIEYYYN